MFTITTPAILFPAISLILLAYTAKFIHLGILIRKLKDQYTAKKEDHVLAQIINIKRRIYLIRNMQGFGIASFFASVLCMLLLFGSEVEAARYAFGASLLFLLISLLLSLKEILISASALKIELEAFEKVKGL